MTGKRRPFKLNQLGFVGRGRSRHRPRNDPSLYGGPYPFFQTGDVKAASFYLSKHSQTYNDVGLAQSKLWEPGTLLITIAANIAETAILRIKGCFPDSVVGFVPDPTKADVKFVKYYIDLIRIRIQRISGGTTQDNLSLDKLMTFDFLIPPLDDQRKSAAILSAYDDLIETNLRRIEILDELAQLLYREWFVKFRFHGREKAKLVDSPYGEIPEGWEAKALGDLVDLTKGKKAKTIDPRPSQDLVPYLLLDGLRTDDFSYANPNGLTIAEEDDVIMVMDGASSGVVFQGFEGAVGSTLARIRSLDRGILSPYLLFRFLSDNYVRISRNNVGTAIPHANKDFIRRIRIPLPLSTLNDDFHQLMGPFRQRTKNLRLQVANVRQTRDLLLPRLISGELDVSALDVNMEVLDT